MIDALHIIACMKPRLLIAVFVLAPLSTLGAQEWLTLAGKIDLLPGYVDHLKPNVICYDSNCGQIWKPGGLTIDYELSNGAYELEGPTMFVYCQDHINGQIVEFALDVDADTKAQRVLVSFPDEAIFNAEVHSPADSRAMITMLMTYHGKAYHKSDDGGAVICGGLRDVFGDAFENRQVHLKHLVTRQQWTAETNQAGHFKLAGLPAGRYTLQTDAFTDDADCKYPARTWQINVQPGEKVVLYRIISSATKGYKCRSEG